MRKQVVFIGGIHGVGKSTICHEAHLATSAIIVKQRHLVKEVAIKLGAITWEDAGLVHNLVIKDAASLVIERVKAKKSSLVLVDCHYSIRQAKALRISSSPGFKGYIPDLDEKFVSVLRKYFELKFILVQTAPEIAFARIVNRPIEIRDVDCSLELMVKSERIEQIYFIQMVQNFQIDQKNFVILNNNGDLSQTLKSFNNFVF